MPDHSPAATPYTPYLPRRPRQHDGDLGPSATLPVDVTTYSVLLVMGTLGVLGIHDWAQRGLAIALCLGFAALHAAGWSRSRPDRQWRMILACQTGLVAALSILHSADYETFGFLLYVLSVHVGLLFGPREATTWIFGFWLVTVASLLWHRGTDGVFGMVFTLGVFPLCGVLGHALREMARAKADSEVALDRLRAAQARIEELAVAEERHRLAHDLHDSVKQQVFAATMQLGAARALLAVDPAGARAALDEADTSSQQAAAELNQVIQALRPLDLAEHGLADTLRKHAREWERRSGIRIAVRVNDERPAARVTEPAVEEAVLRVAQEALANAARHSGAERVDVTLDFEPSAVRLRVADDGDGFQPARADRGVGLESMRDRVHRLGGRFALRSTPGEGTTVDIVLEEHHD